MASLKEEEEREKEVKKNDDEECKGEKEKEKMNGRRVSYLRWKGNQRIFFMFDYSKSRFPIITGTFP